VRKCSMTTTGRQEVSELVISRKYLWGVGTG
jgi:hypothetical protein